MLPLVRILLGAILAVALLIVPVFGAGDDHDTMQGMGDMDASAMNVPAVDGANASTMKGVDVSGMDDMEAMPHDHTKVMEDADATVGVEEKLSNTLADVNFLDSEGNRVNLRELTATVPTIMLPIYFRCPDVCNVLQGSFAQILPDVALKPGKEIQIVSISFDPRETVKDAARAKKTYLAAAGGNYPPQDWKFLTGDEGAVKLWLDSIGFTVKRQGGIFAHPVAIVAIAPGSKVVRYLYGSSFLPFDITMAGTEAATGKPGLSVKRLLSFCYNYDPQGRRYVFDVLRVSGFSIVGFIGLFVLYLVLSGRKRRQKRHE